MYPSTDSIISWRGTEIPHQPQYPGVVYLLHFSARIGNPANPRGQALHYLGSAHDLAARLQQHRSGQGAKLMAAVRLAGLDFQIARLWSVTSWEEQRDLEISLKHRHNSPKLCNICRGLPLDPLASLYQGHWPFHVFTTPGKRQPMREVRYV